MKKLGKKLVLSSLSLGLAVVTLTTTTFAWYTSNTSVNATISGATGETSDTTLTIASTASGPFGKTAAGTKNEHDGSTLQPLQVNSSGALVGLGTGTGFLESATAAGTKDYLQFTVYVKSSKTSGTTPVYLESISVKNTTSSLPEFPILAAYQVSSTDVWTSSQVGNSYKVDATRALSMHVASGDSAVTLDSGYSIGEFRDTTNPTDTLGSSFDALAYYNAFMNPDTALTRGSNVSKELQTITPSTSTSTSDALTVATLTGNTATKLTFTIWLDGWDTACFDACQNQTFSITFSLTSEIGSVKVTKKSA